MNHVHKIIPVMLLASFGFLSLATESAFRMAYVDLQKALQTVEAGKSAKESLEKQVGAKKIELEKAQEDLRKEFEQFEKKAAILNDSTKSAKQAELQKKMMDLQKNAAESQMDLQKKERELTKPIIDQLRSIIQVMGKEKNLHLILEKNEGAVLYAETGSDLTELVIERFNSQNKKKK